TERRGKSLLHILRNPPLRTARQKQRTAGPGCGAAVRRVVAGGLSRNSGPHQLASHSIQGQSKLEQSLPLELPDTFLAELEDSRNGFQGQLAAVSHSEAPLENVAFPCGELTQGAVENPVD